MNASHGRKQNAKRKDNMGTTQNDLHSLEKIVVGSTPQKSNCTTTYLPSHKTFL